jgi:hypothetical protein
MSIAVDEMQTPLAPTRDVGRSSDAVLPSSSPSIQDSPLVVQAPAPNAVDPGLIPEISVNGFDFLDLQTTMPEPHETATETLSLQAAFKRKAESPPPREDNRKLKGEPAQILLPHPELIFHQRAKKQA